MEEYGKWATFQCEMKNQRQASIKELDFPYEYRPGQKKLVSDVYRTIMRQKLLLCRLRPVWERLSLLFSGSEGGW